MNRFLAPVVAVVLLGACRAGDLPSVPAPSAPASPSASPSQAFIRPVFDKQIALGHIRALVSIGARVKGTEGDAKAAEYVETAFRSAGCDASRQAFPLATGGMSQNVVCRFPGLDYSRGYVVAGGHIDTVPGTVGANDNASGVGVTIALATLLEGARAPVELVAFGAEELDTKTREHHEGSRYHVAGISDVSLVRGMVSIDMVGAGAEVVIVRDRDREPGLQDELRALAEELSIPVRTTAEGDVSDHTSFTSAGIPGVLLWTGRHASFHKPSDTMDVIEEDAIERVGRLTLEWILRRTSI